MKNASYGDKIYTKLVRKFREKNNLVPSKAHKDSAFGYHAEGILADCYNGENLRADLGFPPAILDFKIHCSVEESKSVSSGFNVLYLICIY